VGDAARARLEGTQHRAEVYSTKAALPAPGSLEEQMSHATDMSSQQPRRSASVESAPRAIPTFVATDLLEKLIADRDARTVDRVVTATRRH
jgi:hypothetical protein